MPGSAKRRGSCQRQFCKKSRRIASFQCQSHPIHPLLRGRRARVPAPRYGFGGSKLLVSGPASSRGGGLKKPLSWPWGAGEFVVGAV